MKGNINFSHILSFWMNNNAGTNLLFIGSCYFKSNASFLVIINHDVPAIFVIVSPFFNAGKFCADLFKGSVNMQAIRL